MTRTTIALHPRRLLHALLWLALLPFAAGAAFAQATPRSFEHIQTGFALTGQHANARCESCHLNGIFKGTPRDCASCHTAGARWSRGNVVKPQAHVPTQQPCDACHTTHSYTGARFTHVGAGSCTGCHNGALAGGKPPGHVATAASCDSCHRSSAWLPATGFNHAGVAPGSCASCHNGSRATGRGPRHIPYQTLAGGATMSCDACHRAGTTSWTPARFHATTSVSSQCASCHTGGYPPAAGKPATPIHAAATVCENCHKSTSDWAAAKVDHATLTAATNCTSCHNGSAATGKNAQHVPTTANCTSCHSTTAWRPSSFNHTQVPVTNQCSTCHSGAFPPADGRPATHIPYQALAGAAITNCDSCHKAGTSAWTPAKLHATVSVTTQCASCHNGSYPPAVGKPATAIHATATVCETCHKSTRDWAAARVDHSTLTAATNCTSCHNGSAATGKNAQHIPTTANCTSCHSTATWRPSTFNHTQVPVTNQCSVCHSGAFPPADGRHPTHIPYQALTGVAITNCDSCHKAGTSAWTPARFHATVSVATQCASCHTGSYPPAVGKPPTALHAGVTVCESCHKSSTSWTAVSFAHSAANAVGTGTCDTCHNGSTATGKPAAHIPVTTGATKCDNCHRSQASWSAATTMNHAVVATTTCKTCHNGSYVSQGTTGALAKPANHIPEQTQLLNGAAMDCNACHSGTASWTALRMNHNGSQGGGSGWCKGCHLRGTTYAGSMERATMTHKTKTPPAVDCSESGCHRPLGSKGSTYSNWD